MASRSSLVALDAGAVPHATMALFMPIALQPREVAMFGYFGPEWWLLGMRQVAPGLAHLVTIPLREVIADALAFGCIAVVMGHNHPSGDPTPSAADYALTRRLAHTLDAIGVQLVDHLVLARGGCTSFRAAGLL